MSWTLIAESSENDLEDTYTGGCNAPGLPMQVLQGDANGELLLCGRTGFFLVGDLNSSPDDGAFVTCAAPGVGDGSKTTVGRSGSPRSAESR